MNAINVFSGITAREAAVIITVAPLLPLVALRVIQLTFDFAVQEALEVTLVEVVPPAAATAVEFFTGESEMV